LEAIIKKISVTFLAIVTSTLAFSQQWLHFLPSASGDWINIHDLDVSGNAFTLEALVSLHDTSQLNGLNILSKHTAPADVNYILRPNRFEFTTTGGYILAANPVELCLDSVYHLAGTYDGDSVKFYLNGQVVASVAHSGTLVNNNFNAAIGNRAWPTDEQFRGYIDELRIWNIARTPAELSANMYDLPNPTIQPGLIAYYKFDGTFTNAQGNTLWDGGAIGTQSVFAGNPNFSGSISTGFCPAPNGFSETTVQNVIQFFPNPNTGNFTINTPLNFTGKASVKIINSMGEYVMDSVIEITDNHIELSLPGGIYFTFIDTGNDNYVGKLIIQE
jgi:hypothetical protein